MRSGTNGFQPKASPQPETLQKKKPNKKKTQFLDRTDLINSNIRVIFQGLNPKVLPRFFMDFVPIFCVWHRCGEQWQQRWILAGLQKAGTENGSRRPCCCSVGNCGSSCQNVEEVKSVSQATLQAERRRLVVWHCFQLSEIWHAF